MHFLSLDDLSFDKKLPNIPLETKSIVILVYSAACYIFVSNSREIHKTLNAEPHLLRIERSQPQIR